jgi:DNA-binding NarL/FixJ family response regulator
MTSFNNGEPKIRILIVDDQNLIRKALQVYLETEEDLEIVGQAASGAIALEKIEALRPDVIIIDLEMPDMDGFTVIELIKKHDRLTQIKILVLSSYDDSRYINRAISVGAKGYVLKGTPDRELANVIRNINQGYFQLGPGLFEKILLDSQNTASNRELNLEKRINSLLNKFKAEVSNLYDRAFDGKIDKLNEDLSEKLDFRINGLRLKHNEIGFEMRKINGQFLVLIIGQICLLILLIISVIFF